MNELEDSIALPKSLVLPVSGKARSEASHYVRLQAKHFGAQTAVFMLV